MNTFSLIKVFSPLADNIFNKFSIIDHYSLYDIDVAMHLSLNNLEEKPFQKTTDSKFFWPGKQYSDALSALNHGIQEKYGFFLLTGETGIGKTTLTNRLVKTLSPNVIIVKVPDPDSDSLDFFNILAESFDLNKKFTSKAAFFVHFNFFLKSAYSNGEKIILIIDDAQRLNKDLFKELDNLSDIQINNRKMISILLVGQNELDKLVMQQDIDKIQKKITVRCDLTSLNRKETANYIKHHLKTASIKRKIFTSKAVHEIYSSSKGNPYLINGICELAIESANLNGIKKIDKETIKECSVEHQISKIENGESDKKQEVDEKKVWKPIPLSKVKMLLHSPSFVAVLLVLAFTTGYLASKVDLKKLYQNKKEEMQLAKISVVNSSDQKLTVNFKNNSNELTDNALKLLDKIIKFISRYPAAEIIIEGYTDSYGEYWYNKKLSELRANVVKNYLIVGGIPQSKIKVFGRGPENPLDTNTTSEGRKKNRRVEIEIKIDDNRAYFELSSIKIH